MIPATLTDKALVVDYSSLRSNVGQVSICEKLSVKCQGKVMVLGQHSVQPKFKKVII